MKNTLNILLFLVGVLSCMGQDSAIKSPKFQDVPSGTPGGTTRILGLADTGAGVDGESVEEFTKASLQAWLGAVGGTSNVVIFSAEGGVEGSGISQPNRQANWALFKTAFQTAQDSNFNHLFFDKGTWEFEPTEAADKDNPSTYDYISVDGDMTISGAGVNETILHFKSISAFYLFKRQADDVNLHLNDLSITMDIPSDIVTVDTGVSATTFNSVGHGLVTNDVIKIHNYAEDLDLLGGFTMYVTPQGSWPASSAAFPTGARKGDYWFISDVGTIDTVSFAIGDYLVCKTAGSVVKEGWAKGKLPDPVEFDSQSSAQTYYVINEAANTFELSNTPSPGSAIVMTDNGIGTHIVFKYNYSAVFSSGYDIADNWDQESTIILDRVKISNFSNAINNVSASSRMNIIVRDSEFNDLAGVGIVSFSNNGTEDVDFQRSKIVVDSSIFQNKRVRPYGNHFMYIHPHPLFSLTNSELKNCWYFGVQFQNSSGTMRGVQQTIANNVFRNNRSHIISARTTSDRSNLLIEGNHFEGDGAVEIRSNAMIVGNLFKPFRASAISTSSGGADKFTVHIKDNEFMYYSNGTTSNAMLDLSAYGPSVWHISNNLFARHSGFSSGAQMFIGTIGQSGGTTNLPRYYFHNNVYSLDTIDDARGWGIYPAQVQFSNEKWDGAQFMAYPLAAGSSESRLWIDNCDFDLNDGSGVTVQGALSVSYSGWELTGKNNRFRDGAYIVNGANTVHNLNFGQGHGGTIASAASIYIDPSFDSFDLSGATNITNIYVGISGNVAADATAVNYQKMWRGSITLNLPSGVSLNGGGNISNGPFSPGADSSVSLQYLPSTNTWRIK